jgi:hypothetical protein
VLISRLQIHFVSFDADGRIRQIRQSWDQGSLLKLIDVIGKTGRNWPIRDGQDQIKRITSSVRSAGRAPADAAPDRHDAVLRARADSHNVTRDPHATLQLFSPREKSVQNALPAAVLPRASARPAPRELSELFVGTEADLPPPTTPSQAPRERSASPTKTIASKAGAGKHFAPSRLFDNDENSPSRPSPNQQHSTDHFLRPHPAKYQHFAFADGSDPQDAPRPAPVKDVPNKHASQWNFEDFNTPAKVIPSRLIRTNDVRHWGTEEDVLDSPVKVKKVDKPRKDAETHFEFQDDGTREEPRAIGRPRGAGHNAGLGLYRDPLFSDVDAAADAPEPKPLKPISNIKDRSKDFEPHFTMADESPAAKPASEGLRDDRAKAVQMLDATWSAYDLSPHQKENAPLPTSRPNPGASKGPLSETTNAVSNRSEPPRGITIAGDGMGSRKGASTGSEGPRGISIGGDGMGGMRGTGRQWGFGDESDGEEAGGVNAPSKFRTGKQHKPQPTGGDFWDF